MEWLWFFLISWLSKSVRSNDLFLMTSDKCITNSTFPMVINYTILHEEKTDKLLVQSTTNNSCSELFSNKKCCGSYCLKDWRIETSSDELITDWRWKGLKTFDLSSSSIKLKESFFLNDTIILPISVRSSPIQIQFLKIDGSYILLELHADSSFIRTCNKFTHKCSNFNKTKKRTNSQTWISEDYWSHLILEKNNSVLKAILNNQEIISYNTNLTNIEKIKVLNGSGFIKIHDYKYLYSNQTGKAIFGPKLNTSKIGCFKFWTRMCINCSLNISLGESQNLTLNQTIQTTTWKEIRIKLPKSNQNVSLYLEKISSEQNDRFWAIGDISTCTKEGMESITRKTNDTCELVNGYGNLTISSKKYNEGMVQLTEFSHEEEDSNYKKCTDEICGKSKVCSLSFDTFTVSCYCPLGTKIVDERNCTPCSKGFFGWNCTKTCEGCKEGCNYEGLCINRANTNNTCKSKKYEGEYCDIRPEAVNRSTIKISFNARNNNTVVNWSYPNVTKNKISSFYLDIDSNNYTHNVSNETEASFSKVIEEPPEKTIKFKIQACNRKCSDKTQIWIYTPPLKANIKEDTFKYNFYDGGGINITLPSVEKKCNKCNTTILLAINNCTRDIKFKRDTMWTFNYENYTKIFPLYIKKGNTVYLSNYLNKTLTYPVLNCANFKLAVRVISTFNGQENNITKCFSITRNNIKLNEVVIETQFVPIAVTSSLLLLLLVLAGIFVYFKRKNILIGVCIKPASSNQVLEQTNDDVLISLLPRTSNSNVLFTSSTRARSKRMETHKMPGTTKSKMVLLGRFEEYIKCSLEKNDLKNQHEEFPKGLLYSYTRGSLPENKSKNRYGNILPYNHSRVILETIDNDEYSDYINANYIDGYHTENAYIAAQAPKDNTVKDFWRMIWQENVRNIIMIGNVLENGKKKISQYWPEINEQIQFRNINVTLVSEQVFANYIYRQLSVAMDEDTREVNHLQFTSWPDHGVPFYAESLVPFLKKMLEIQIDSNSPILVHCSAGVGRTGTILLCDMTLRLANAEDKIDIFNYMEYLRTRRPNLVDNYEQYKLVHLVVLECLSGFNTNVTCDSSVTYNVKQIIANEIDAQMNYLKEIEWHDDIMTNPANKLIKTNVLKNRFLSIIPETNNICLTRYPSDDETSTYINAVYVEGYQELDRFIATQHPLPHTIGDFWRMVVQVKCTEIISLNDIDPNDETSCQFWPENQEVLAITNDLYIEHVQTEDLKMYQVIQLNVCSNGDSWSVNFLLYKNWSFNEILPPNLEDFVTFSKETDFYLRKSKPVIVTCFNGATACGLFLGLLFVIDKINFEQIIDVCQAVRYIRHNRKQFISDKDQFVFLYKAALQYIKIFEMYSNFS